MRRRDPSRTSRRRPPRPSPDAARASGPTTRESARSHQRPRCQSSGFGGPALCGRTRNRRHLRRERERGGRPARRGGRDPLVHAVRKSALEVGLDRYRTRLDDPRAVVDLRAQQELEALAIGAIGERHRAALAQRIERLAGRVGVARHRVELRPTAVVVLQRHQLARRGGDDVGRRAGPVQAEQPERALFGVVAGAVISQARARSTACAYSARRVAARRPAAPASRSPSLRCRSTQSAAEGSRPANGRRGLTPLQPDAPAHRSRRRRIAIGGEPDQQVTDRVGAAGDRHVLHRPLAPRLEVGADRARLLVAVASLTA